MELELDFSEEDVEFADRSQVTALASEIEQKISRLAHSFDAGNAIKGGNANFVNCQRRTGLNIRPVFVIKRAYANSGGFDTDGINTIQQTTSQDDAIYNLQGIKVQGELKPGIYIQNGKKFVVK